MARLVRTATALQAELPADHPSARLLAVAIMRRDESLLKALVSSLSKARER